MNTTKAQLGTVVGDILGDERALGPSSYWARKIAASHGWDLGDVIDAAQAATSAKWVYFSGLGLLDDRYECDVCGTTQVATHERIIDAHRDPTLGRHLACGHWLV